jgi:hypothetical protein
MHSIPRFSETFVLQDFGELGLNFSYFNIFWLEAVGYCNGDEIGSLSNLFFEYLLYFTTIS